MATQAAPSGHVNGAARLRLPWARANRAVWGLVVVVLVTCSFFFGTALTYLTVLDAFASAPPSVEQAGDEREWFMKSLAYRDRQVFEAEHRARRVMAAGAIALGGAMTLVILALPFAAVKAVRATRKLGEGEPR